MSKAAICVPSPGLAFQDIKLRQHQQAAFDEASAYLNDHGRVTICMPCGTGKTLLGQRLGQQQAQQGSASILVLVPSLSLLVQTMQTWVDHSPRPINALAFCHDLKLSTAQLPVTTDPAALADWMREATAAVQHPDDPQPVVFATYHSSPRIAEAHRKYGLPAFCATIADEAHCCAGRFEAAFATVVDESKILSAVRIFLTATPRVRRHDNTTAFCMDSEAAFGRMIMPIPLRTAIDQGLLSDYEIAIVTVTDEDIRAVITPTDDSPIETKIGAVAAVQAATQVAIGTAVSTYGLSRIMVFHNGIEASRTFANTLQQVLGVEAAAGLVTMHLDGDTPAGIRKKHLDTLADPGPDRWAVLSNVRCLGQGIDVPALDGIVFAAPRTSTIDITQCVGRALRIDPQHPDRRAVIVLPVFVADGSPLAEQVAGSGYKHVYRTLLAMADQDAAIADELANRPRHRRGRRSSSTPSPAPDTDGHISVLSAAGAPASEQLRAALRLRTLQLLTPGWEFGYQQLLAYADKHGRCCPDSYVTDEGYPLGSWTRGQRQRRETLSSEHRSKLEAVPGWAWNRFDAAWKQSYEHLVQWAAQHGDVTVLRGTRTPDGTRMDQWPTVQRSEYRAGTLDPERIALLEALPGWSWNPNHDRWATGYKHLQTFAASTGTANPSRSVTTVDGFKLGNWVAAQRRFHQLGQLAPEKVAALEDLTGWTFNILEARWQAGLAELQRFYDHHGHLQVPQNFRTPDGDQLGKWVSNQRTAKRSGRLSNERITALEALSGWTWTPKSIRTAAIGITRHCPARTA
ncbi:Helicase associated domain protein [Mycobacteroides salmoniphilum]|uniref:DEAD/DEAH box helicase n=1 Tax=Mycobacteroides salmoniphilum TaxID=404941 RepID=UPI0035670B39